MDKHRKMVKQNELRRLMKVKSASTEIQKISSPLAKYDSQNNLSCVICKAPVKSANAWKVHINSQKHKANLDILSKGLKKDPNGLKASILAQKPKQSKTNENTGEAAKIAEPLQEKDYLPFSKRQENQEIVDKTVLLSKNEHVLPENFFDPKPQSKSDLKDSVQEEWERFQKEIKEESLASHTIIAEDHEVATVDRQLVEIDEQIHLWSKVVNLEDKKKMLNFDHLKKSTNANQVESISDDDDDDNEEFEEFSNWRCKKFDTK